MPIHIARHISLMLVVLIVMESQASAQETNQRDPSSPTQDSLRDDQLAISGRFARFERMLSQMADVLGRQDPEKADLLRRAISKGREDRIGEDIEAVVELLEKGELGGAGEQQTEVIDSLKTLLKLLQSEDRRSSVERERERLNGLLKDVRGVMAQQKSVRIATQNAEAPSSAAPGQQKAIDESDKTLKEMEEHDQKNAKPKDQQAGESGKEGSYSENGKPAADDPKNEDAEKGESSESSKPPKSGKSGDQQPGDPNSQGEPKECEECEKSPGRAPLESAREQMQQAIEALKQQQRESAINKEDKALALLQQAVDMLEEQLKQLREEEKEMMLASLEARFQRMLATETQIHEGTVTLSETPQQDWLDQYYSRCRELAQQQSALTDECLQTVNLLREDGTSVSILLAVEDIGTDMRSVADWLQESNVTELTRTVQADILESLKQLIEATQQEMQDMQDEKQQQQQQGQPSQQKSELVKLMAEIRMLRTMQLQVNRRTVQLSAAIKSASAEQQLPLRRQLQELAARQQRLTDTTRELARQSP